MRMYALQLKCHDAVMILRLLRTQNVYRRDLLHALHQQGCQLCFSLFDKIKTDLLHIADSLCEGISTCTVHRTCLELMRHLCPHGSRTADGIDHFSTA